MLSKEERERLYFRCSDCGGRMHPTQFRDGTYIPIRRLEWITEHRYGRRLCAECMKRADPECEL